MNVKIRVPNLEEADQKLIDRISQLVLYSKQNHDETLEITVSSELEILVLQLLQIKGEIDKLTIKSFDGDEFVVDPINGIKGVPMSQRYSFYKNKAIDIAREILNFRLKAKTNV